MSAEIVRLVIAGLSCFVPVSEYKGSKLPAAIKSVAEHGKGREGFSDASNTQLLDPAEYRAELARRQCEVDPREKKFVAKK